MMRGIEGVVALAELEVGRFYLAPNQDEEPTLFQCVEFVGRGGGEPRRMALTFPYGEAKGIELLPMDVDSGIVAMPEVSVRVDPPSARESGGRSRVALNVLLVAGTEPCIAVGIGVRDHAVFSLATGRTVEQRRMADWVSFSRWSLVVDQAGEEIAIAAFGEN